MTNFILPDSVFIKELTDRYGKIVMEPLERGYGMTIGNALRRVLLSSIPGAAVVRVVFDGKYHEYETITGVRETVLEIILNIKELALRLLNNGVERLYINKKGPCRIRAADIEPNVNVQIINHDLHIASLNTEGKLDLEMEIETGYGYRPAELNRLEDSPRALIPVDSDFSPVKQVNFKIEEMRVGGRTGYERLLLDLTTDGGIRPEEAINEAAHILQMHFNLFEKFAEHPFRIEKSNVLSGEETLLDQAPAVPLSELDFDVRTLNVLLKAGITTIDDLRNRSREELSDFHGLGPKTLAKIIAKLADYDSAREKQEGGVSET
ncbi:DNA-directed RNA polymerase subunit alpha [Candidatus Acetothermia bacterium]|jgi:DNA-directed RNA polymerase subunit alpha|nr:DNA-directed RNA polymerase subunit alpha [Candidatus Acetothermia bacterium]MCI2427584.1 DNA-directed RNA polymerase subunit alpha [Candidatus Acetothermia bacterium]MCI2428196.1 DNA-directed RNA polymerase subunit alpha [Candidatus Acetothermia bacterium]